MNKTTGKSINEFSRPVALVTGASRGIGRAIAKRLEAQGYELFLICHQDVQDLSDFSGSHFAGNVGDEGFVSGIISSMPRLDVLVNNAGISWVGLLQDMSPAEWNEVISTNLTSLYNTCHAAIPRMLENHSGHILNISSVWGLCGSSTEVAYSASKGGVNAFTRALAKELAPSGIQVNAIACGLIDTDMNRCFSEEDIESLKEEIPAGRMGRPEEVAQLVLSIINGPAYLTGQVVSLDGGWI